jgi:hypothetical protein
MCNRLVIQRRTYIIIVVHKISNRVFDINDKDLPICLATVIQSQTTKNLNLLHLTRITWILADIEEVHGIVITWEAGKVMIKVGTFPSLRDRSIQKRVGPVRPDGFDETRFIVVFVMEDRVQRLLALDLDLAICPAWNLHNGVDDLLVILVWV